MPVDLDLDGISKATGGNQRANLVEAGTAGLFGESLKKEVKLGRGQNGFFEVPKFGVGWVRGHVRRNWPSGGSPALGLP